MILHSTFPTEIDYRIAQCGANPMSMGIQCANGTCVGLGSYGDCVPDCDDGIDERWFRVVSILTILFQYWRSKS